MLSSLKQRAEWCFPGVGAGGNGESTQESDLRSFNPGLRSSPAHGIKAGRELTIDGGISEFFLCFLLFPQPSELAVLI
jgi:hypothetical protein